MAFIPPLLASAGTFLGSAAGISTALAAAATAVTVASSVQQGHYQAAVAKNNALIAEQNAAKASEAAQQEAQRRGMESGALLAQQLAMQAASGIDVGSKSFLQTRQLTQRVGAQEQKDIAGQGSSAARRLLQDAANYRSEASAASKQGTINAIGAGLQFGSDIFNKGSLASRKTTKMPWDTGYSLGGWRWQ
jgi:hypothetical protein